MNEIYLRLVRPWLGIALPLIAIFLIIWSLPYIYRFALWLFPVKIYTCEDYANVRIDRIPARCLNHYLNHE